MFRNAANSFRHRLCEWRRRMRTRDVFGDGSSLSEVHRYAIRYTSSQGNYVDIGYEVTTGSNSIWLIHEDSFPAWDAPNGVTISPQERNEILGKVAEYCGARRRPFRLVT